MRPCRSFGVRRDATLFQIRMDSFGRDMPRNPGSGTLLFPALQSFGPPALLLTLFPLLPLNSSSGSLVFTLIPQSCSTSPPTWEASGNKKALCFPVKAPWHKYYLPEREKDSRKKRQINIFSFLSYTFVLFLDVFVVQAWCSLTACLAKGS